MTQRGPGGEGPTVSSGGPAAAASGAADAAGPERDDRVRWVRRGLAAVGLAAAAHVVLAPSPWALGVTQRLDLSGYVSPPDAMPFVWCGSLLVAAVAALLALGARRWIGPRTAPDDPRLALPPRPGRGFVLGVVAATAVTAGLAIPRMDLGLWDDEIYSVRHSMVGRYRMKDDVPRFRPVSWRETLWHYRMPNNHVPYSLAARVSAEGWLALARPAERLRVEVPVRLPALAFGLLVVPAAALLLWRVGLAEAGALAAALLGLHPWMVRYASEARGYSLVMLLVVALTWALVEVLRRGSWPRWTAFGAAQLGLLWAYPAALPVVACANVVLAALLLRRLGGRALGAQLARQAVVGFGGAALFLWLMLPNLIQLAGYTAEKQHGEMGLPWWQDVGAHMLAGMPWSHRIPHPFAPQLVDRAEAAPALLAAAVALAAVATAAGALRLARRRGDVGVGLAAVLLLPAPLVYGLAAARGTFLHPWYLVFTLPGLVLLAAAGFEGLLARLARRAPAGARGLLRAGGFVGLLGAFAALTAPVHAVMREHTFSARRESVLLTRPDLDPNSKANARILTACMVDALEYYDPRSVQLRDGDDLRRLMRRADAEGLPLFVNTGRMWLAHRRHPEAAALVDDPALFEAVATLHGLVPRLTRHVYRYRGASDGGARAAARPR